jgi:hypothetical protein
LEVVGVVQQENVRLSATVQQLVSAVSTNNRLDKGLKLTSKSEQPKLPPNVVRPMPFRFGTKCEAQESLFRKLKTFQLIENIEGFRLP